MINRFHGSLLAGMMALAANSYAQTNTWELGHPDAKLMIGIDLKALRESPAGQLVWAQWKAQPQRTGPEALTTGFLEQVDRVFISSPALPVAKPAVKPPAGKSPVKTAVAAAPNNPPFLLVVEGTLPLQQLLAFLPGTSHRYHDIDIFQGNKTGDKTKDASIAALDARTTILGDEKSVESAIDRRGKAVPPASPILKRAKELAATHEVWIIAEDSLSRFQPQGAGTNPMAAELLAKIKGVDMGISMHDGMQFELALGTENETVAGQMAQMMSGQLSMAMLAQANNPQAADMAKRLHIDTDGPHVRVSFALTAEEIALQVKTAQAAMAANHQTRAETVAPPAARPQPKPATPGKVTIYGLDEGTKVIQLTH